MPVFNRRDFLQTSIGGFAALSLGSTLLADKDKHRKSFDPDSLFLTWQQDPTTTMTIQWVGEKEKADVSIEFAPFKGGVWQNVKTQTKHFPGTDLKVFRCELTGLEPGADYKFQIGQRSPEYHFRTMPAKATDEFSFISGGDAGVGSHAIDSNQIAAKQDPFFVLIGGDLAYDNGRSPKTFLKFLQNYSRTMHDSKGRLIPLISCLGNHEVDGGYKGTPEKAASYLSVFDGFYSETSYGVLDIGDYLSLVLLDTGHLSPIKGEQTDWLKSTLKEREDFPHVIAVNHVPCYPSYRDLEHTGEDQRKLWCPLFERYKIDLVLEHHDHTFKRSHPLIDGQIDKNGVLYLGDGSWGKVRPPKKLSDRLYLAKISESYHVTKHVLQGSQRFHVALEGDGKVADVATTTSKRPSR